jgi:glycosyltransferase involved in cell wall biosynthesis
MIIEIDADDPAAAVEKLQEWERAKSALVANLDGVGAPSIRASHTSREWPLVDALMPAFNAERTVRSTLESIFAQDYQRFRLIVVDDGSNDSTVDIVREFGNRLQPILLVRAKHGGIVDALNAGLAHVAAPIAARFDADDVSFPNRLTDQVSFLLEHPDYVAISSSFYAMDEDGFITDDYRRDGSELSHNVLDYPAYEPMLPHSLMTVRTSAYVRLKYRYVHNAEDADLWWRLLRHGKLAVMKEIHGCYRIHDDSVSGKSVVEGRIQAIFSQLAALSARRVLALKPDLEFRKSDLAAARSARLLRQMLDLFRERLSAKEWLYLQAAAPLKLLEFIRYRPYGLEMTDIAVFCESLANVRAARGDQRRKIRVALNGAIRKGFRSAPLAEKFALFRRYPRQVTRAFLRPG